jgi:ABC-type Fe3+ transport system substrate-binding protein
MHYPKHRTGAGGGTLLIPNTVGAIRNCSNQKLAETFIDFMLSDEVATILASSASKNIPLQHSVLGSFPELIVENPLEVSFQAAAFYREKAINRVMEAHRDGD